MPRRDRSMQSIVIEHYGTNLTLNQEREILVEMREKFLALSKITTGDTRRRWALRAQFLKNEAEDVLDELNARQDALV